MTIFSWSIDHPAHPHEGAPSSHTYHKPIHVRLQSPGPGQEGRHDDDDNDSVDDSDDDDDSNDSDDDDHVDDVDNACSGRQAGEYVLRSTPLVSFTLTC